jgi:hypothetical protein
MGLNLNRVGKAERMAEDSLFNPHPLTSRALPSSCKIVPAADSFAPIQFKHAKNEEKRKEFQPESPLNVAITSKNMNKHQSQPLLDGAFPNYLMPKLIKNVKTNQLTVSRQQAPILGLKYHLGHTAYLPKGLGKDGKKVYLTKSSIRINKLKDMMHIMVGKHQNSKYASEICLI